MDPMRLLIITMIVKAIPWVLLGGAIFALYRSPLGRALAERLRHGSVGPADVAALADELQGVRRELAEVQERLDFTERAIAQQKSGPRLQSDDRSQTPSRSERIVTPH